MEFHDSPQNDWSTAHLFTMDHSHSSLTPHSASASANLESLLSQFPPDMPSRNERVSRCCCGQLQCAYLEQNNAALRGLEKDLRSAAQIGQVRAHMLEDNPSPLPFMVMAVTKCSDHVTDFRASGLTRPP